MSILKMLVPSEAQYNLFLLHFLLAIQWFLKFYFKYLLNALVLFLFWSVFQGEDFSLFYPNCSWGDLKNSHVEKNLDALSILGQYSSQWQKTCYLILEILYSHSSLNGSNMHEFQL